LKFGITERGDAARDFGWASKMDSVVGAILITKNIDDPEFQKLALQFKHKVIVHATITGFGGTFIEPNVSSLEKTTEALKIFSNEFPREQLVLRTDPIIPTVDKFTETIKVIEALKGLVPRLRFSFIDNYKHVKSRGLKLPWDTFHAPKEVTAEIVKVLRQFEPAYKISACGEPGWAAPSEWLTGCLSAEDYEILGLELPNGTTKSMQRQFCRCLNTKFELLTKKQRCENGCLYCYWRKT